MEVSPETKELARAIAKAQHIINAGLKGGGDGYAEDRADRYADARWMDYKHLADVALCMLLERGFDLTPLVD